MFHRVVLLFPTYISFFSLHCSISSLNTDVQINKHHANENKKSYLFGVCNSKGISHHDLGLAEIQRQAGSEKLHNGEKVRMLCPAWRLLAREGWKWAN